LKRLFVHTGRRFGGIIGPRAYFRRILHRGGKRGVPLGRNAPVRFQARF
jgi:hypothetical protein